MQIPQVGLGQGGKEIFNSREDSNTQGENPEEDTSNPSGTTTGRGMKQGQTQQMSHSYSLHKRTRGEHQEDLQQIWDPDSFQGE